MSILNAKPVVLAALAASALVMAVSMAFNDKRLCVVCRVYPVSPEYTVTCSFTCIQIFCQRGSGDARMCDVCHRRPKRRGQQQCGNECAGVANVACLLCKYRPKDGRHDLCSLTCKKVVMILAPCILEVPRGHAIYDMVEGKFKRAWKDKSSPIPVIRKVFKIIENEEFQKPYELYRVDLAKATGAFGVGVYTSSASNKAYSYCKPNGALLLNKVVLGRVRQVSGWNEVMSCPQGYNSVIFERRNGILNETILYCNDAIRPVFLIIF
ncbi:hypothetical protein H1R20_g13027, partial [Candolleomyces eurysporus]